MPYSYEFVEPELLVEYKGVCVYREYKNHDIECPCDFWVCVYPEDETWNDDDSVSFDVRELPGYEEAIQEPPKTGKPGMIWRTLPKPALKTLLRSAIDAGIIQAIGVKNNAT